MSGRELNILVTGGTGAIGPWVVMALVNRGFRPTVLVRGITNLGIPILRELEGKIDWVYGDIQDPWLLYRTIAERKIDSIIHMASVRVPETKALLGADHIIKGMLNILEVARSMNLRRVVYTSSKAVYGNAAGVFSHPTYQPVPEEYECKPKTLYGIYKLAAEQLGFYYHEHFSLDFVALRFAITFGPLKREVGHNPVVYVREALAGKTIPFPDSPKRQDFVYNKDVAEGVCLACLQPRLKHRVFNIGSGRGYSLQDVANAVQKVLPGAIFEKEKADLDVDGCIYDISKSREDLGYEPRYDLEEAIRDLVYEETAR